VAALTLAHTVHLFLATDNYAQQRKIYNPLPMADRLRSLEALLNDIRCADRVEIEGLEQVSDMQTYAEGRKELDLVIAERAYFEWFAEWNDRRVEKGLIGYYILCQPRTTIHGWTMLDSYENPSANF
jgi:phosphopantetheine adenylyltransferase